MEVEVKTDRLQDEALDADELRAVRLLQLLGERKSVSRESL